MTLVDTNITYSKQVCDMAIGALAGSRGILYLLGRLLLICLGFYTVYRITEIFIRKYKKERR